MADLLHRLVNHDRAKKGLPPLPPPPEPHGCALPPDYGLTKPPVEICGTPWIGRLGRRAAIARAAEQAKVRIASEELKANQEVYEFGRRCGIVDFDAAPDEIRNNHKKFVIWALGWIAGEFEIRPGRQSLSP